MLMWGAAALGQAGAIAAASQAPVAPAATPALPDGPGRETLMRVCAGCHAPQIVSGQRLDAAGWKDMVETMANNGAVATDAELAEITGYLVRAFPADKAPG